MRGLDMTIRRATRHDARALAPLINQAGEGLPALIWAGLAAPGQDPWQVGVSRVESEDAGVSFRNAWVGHVHGKLAGCLLAYRQPDLPEPIPDDALLQFAAPLSSPYDMTVQELSDPARLVIDLVPRQ